MADLSGSIATNATAQDLAAFNPRRTALVFQNLSADTLWLGFGADAVEDRPSFKVESGETLTLGAEYRELLARRISVIGPNSGAEFTAFDSLR